MAKADKVAETGWREKQNQVLHRHQNQGENKKRFKTTLLAYIRITIINCFAYVNAVKSPY